MLGSEKMVVVEASLEKEFMTEKAATTNHLLWETLSRCLMSIFLSEELVTWFPSACLSSCGPSQIANPLLSLLVTDDILVFAS